MPALRDSPLLLLLIVAPTLCAVVELGYRLAKRHGFDETRHEQFAVTRDQSGVLLSLLLGFTLAIGMSRYDLRTEQMVRESNAIGTARLRAALVAEPHRAELLRLLDDYARARVELLDAGTDPRALARVRAKSTTIQGQLWTQATSAAEGRRDPLTGLVLASMNELIDADGARIAGLENRIPRTIWVMLGVLAIFSSLMAGLAMRKRSLAGMLVPTLMFTIVALLVADLDTPGKGLISPNEGPIQRLLEP